MSAPRLLLSTETLLGVTRHPRAEARALQTRFADAAALAQQISAALDAGADGVLAAPSAVTRAALSAAGRPVPTWALLPNVPAYVRDSSEAGLAGAAIKRVRGAGPGTLARLGLTGVQHALGVVGGDFASMVPLLLELESAALGAARLEGVVIAAAITDLALAGRNRRFFAHLTAFMRARFRARAGFETHNVGHLLRALRDWGVEPDLVVGPMNPQGFMMKPTPERALEEIAIADVPVLAKELTAGGIGDLATAAAWAGEHGAHGLVVDLADVRGEARELAKLVPVAGARA
ncbi:MAG: hypothetical protein IT347_09190 [Candidatus Eisenbacteria bacterium]|nr:hypothetical protein [Candidatus Eisenbacteria bacterium]